MIIMKGMTSSSLQLFTISKFTSSVHRIGIIELVRDKTDKLYLESL